MAGLLDIFNTDEGRLGLGLLAAAAPSMTPMNGAGRMGIALQTVNGLRAQDAEQAMRRMQMERGGLELDQMRQKVADDKASREVLQGVYGVSGMPGGARPSFGMPSSAVDAALPSQFQIGTPQQPAQAQGQQPPPKVDVYSQYKAIGDQFAARGIGAKAQQYYELAEKYRPKYNTTPQQMMVGGKLMNVLVSEDGTAKTMDGFAVKPDMVEMDLGGAKQWADKNAISPGQSFAKSMTPGETASNTLGWANNKTTERGQNLTDARARETIALGRIPTGYRATADGKGLEFVPGGPADPNSAKKAAPTEFQGKSTTFGARMQDAAKVIGELEGKVWPSTVARAGYRSEMPDWMPGGQAMAGAATALNRSFVPADAQRYYQAQENWVTANLRQESGAAIGKDEMAKDITKWFPQPGDSKAVIEQKASARKVAERAMTVQAGPGASSIPGIMGDAPLNAGSSQPSTGVQWRYENGKLVKVP